MRKANQREEREATRGREQGKVARVGRAGPDLNMAGQVEEVSNQGFIGFVVVAGLVIAG